MKIDKLSIIKLMLLEQGVFTYQKLATSLSISSKTIRNQIEDIEDFLNKYDIYLERHAGIGIRLIGNQQNILDCYKQCLTEIKVSKDIPSHIRQNIIIFFLLNKTSKITMSFLEDTLFITRPSIYNDLKEVDSYFEKYDIKILKSRKDGIYLDAGEKRIRKCLVDWSANMLSDDKVNYYQYPEIIAFMDYVYGDYNNHHRTFLRNFISNIKNYANLDITHHELERMITLLLISFDRLNKGYNVTIDTKLKNKIKNKKILEYFDNNKVVLNFKFSITLNHNELIYFASILSSNLTTSYEIAFSESSNPQLLFEIIDIYYNTLLEKTAHFDKDYFRTKMFPYLEKIMQKSNFEYDLYNPNVDKIHIIYPKLFCLAELINPIMAKIVNKQLNRSGLATITVLLATIREKTTSGLICHYILNDNIFEDDLNMQILYNSIPNLTIVNELNIVEQSACKIDFIISTNQITNSNIPVFVCPPIFTEDFINLLKINTKILIEQKSDNFII